MPLEETIADSVVQEVVKRLKPFLEKSDNPVLSEKQVLEMLDISAKTLKRMREDGLVAYRPYGVKYYYFENDLKNFIKRKGRAI